MTETKERPLVTFAVIAYNQERFIREAIEGAFAQTYEPLEIILSDDCSPDSTFQIMQEMADEYEGPHDIVLNRNPVNLGLVPHIDRVMEIVSGDLIIQNAGDDVSMPERTEALANIWLRATEEIMLVHSPVKLIDETSDVIGRFTSPQSVLNQPTTLTIGKGTYILGASTAWSRKLFEVFGPLGNGITVEDTIIPFRASLLGRIEYLPNELLKWRVGGASTMKSQRGAEYDYLYGASHRKRKWRSENDYYILDRFHDIPYTGKEQVEAACRKRAAILQFAIDLAESTPGHRWMMLPRAMHLVLRHRRARPMKHWARYTFESNYLHFEPDED